MSASSCSALHRIPALSREVRDRLHTYVSARLDVPLDDRFRYSDHAALCCTELVLKEFQAAGIDLTTRQRRVEMVELAEPAYAPDALRKNPGSHAIPMRRTPRVDAPFENVIQSAISTTTSS